MPLCYMFHQKSFKKSKFAASSHIAFLMCNEAMHLQPCPESRLVPSQRAFQMETSIKNEYVEENQNVHENRSINSNPFGTPAWLSPKTHDSPWGHPVNKVPSACPNGSNTFRAKHAFQMFSWCALCFEKINTEVSALDPCLPPPTKGGWAATAGQHEFNFLSDVKAILLF